MPQRLETLEAQETEAPPSVSISEASGDSRGLFAFGSLYVTTKPMAFDDGDLLAARQEDGAPATSAEAFLTSKGLAATLSATSSLVRSMFGVTAQVVPQLRVSRESGEQYVVFDLLTSPHAAFEDEERFLDTFLTTVPGATDENAPTLMWNPSRVDQG